MTESLRFLLLGHPVGHSVSPAIHGAAYRALGAAHRYEVCDCPTPDDVRTQVGRLRAGEIAGANVTVPWKRLALELADRADASARATGVANVLSRAKDGRIVASNTDAGALAEEITALHGAPRSAAVIGAGGAAQAAVVACASLGISLLGVSSRGWRLDVPRESWKHASVFESLGAQAWAWPDQAGDARPDVFRACLRNCDVIIQATSAGMRGAGPGEAVSDWVPWSELPRGAVAIDVVYNPSVTPFLRAAEAAQVAYRGGLGMLVRQAALALRIWLGDSPGWVEPDLAELSAAAEAALAQQEALVIEVGDDAAGRDGVWPEVVTRGELEPAEREWLHTNGAGAYAMSTLALMHTRRFHGLLVASLDPPLRRYVIVSQMDAVLNVGQRIYRLSTHQFPNVAATPGYRLLESFAQDPIPRWTFRLGRATLDMRLCLARGESATVIAYTWDGPRRARLSLKPLFAMRPIHDVIHEHGSMLQTVSMRHGEVEIQPLPDLPPVVFGHSGVFMGSPDWWRRFEYPVDRLRSVKHQEDLWTPGTFELDLQPGQIQYLTFALERLPRKSAQQTMEEVCATLRALDPGEEHSIVARRLSIAAEQFRADGCNRPGVISGYPWLDLGSRDALIALPGLYLVGGRIEAAKRVLATLIGARADGLLTRGIAENGSVAGQVPADSSLWLFEVTERLTEKTGRDDEFVRRELYPVLVGIFERVMRGPSAILWRAGDGLVANGNAGVAAPLTWMDSLADGVAVTPRAGLAVELQGLWGRACSTLAALAARYGDAALEARALAARAELRAAFARRFWCSETRYPYDCLSEQEEGAGSFRDPSIRPNALIALAIDPELFTHWQAVAIIERVRERLLTPIGLRTLEPRHPDYRGDFRGPMNQRQAAYHQGTCWVFLLGYFARAALALDPNDFELMIELRHAIERVLGAGPLLGQIAQVASGDFPHTLGGCPAQAWSVAELLRSLEELLD